MSGIVLRGNVKKSIDYQSGDYKIEGNVTINAVGTSRRVTLFLRDEMKPIREIFSNPDGSYGFYNLKYQEYALIAWDYEATYDAVINDRVLPELM